MSNNAVGEIVPYTFKDTGITVNIRKVSPLLAMELSRAFPAPEPPMQEVDYGDGVKKMEQNPAHPDYIKAQAEYQIQHTERMRQLIVERGVVHTLTDEQKAAVAELREFWKNTFDKELVGSDKMVFISYLAIGTDSDLEELIDVIIRRSQPTAEGVRLAQESFRG